jgi:hypothetical protein
MLECDFCGCYTPKPGRGWAAYHRSGPNGIDEPRVAVFCPPCAAAVHGHRPDVAAKYVCIWKPQDSGPNLAQDEGAGS